jgi:hypothetical protein
MTIRSHVANDAYRDGWAVTFAKARRETEVAKLCEPCATKRIGSDCRGEECLCLGIFQMPCHDCGTPIGDRVEGGKVPYFVQWSKWFEWRAKR